jgi:hypothetical protein
LAPLLSNTSTFAGYPINWHAAEPSLVTAKNVAEWPLALGNCFESWLSDSEELLQEAVPAPVVEEESDVADCEGWFEPVALPALDPHAAARAPSNATTPRRIPREPRHDSHASER